MNKITALIIGAGDRGFTYSRLGKERMIAVAVAENNKERRIKFSDEFRITPENQFNSFEEALNKDKLADICIITTPDELHFAPAKLAIEAGYDILLEKPICNRKEDISALLELNRKHRRFIGICHVLRYAPFYKKLKEMLSSSVIGEVMTVEHSEGIGWWHFAHSYVRGNWRNMKKSSPTILAKSCHDIDLILWLIGKNCIKVSSFGSLKHFKKDNAPLNSADYCIYCNVEKDCPYSAKKLYLDMNIKGWPVSVITEDMSYEGRLNAISKGPYGKCVYKSDNDAVDHQVVSFKFEDGVTASFTMSAFTVPGRKIRIMGTLGELSGDGKDIIHNDFRNGRKSIIHTGAGGNDIDSGHGGGDSAMLNSFLDAFENKGSSIFSSTLEESAQSHFIAFAAEESRLKGEMITI